MEDGMTNDELFETTKIDPWFLSQLRELHQAEQWVKSKALTDITTDEFIQVKKRGFSDIQISRLTGDLRGHLGSCNLSPGLPEAPAPSSRLLYTATLTQTLPCAVFLHQLVWHQAASKAGHQATLDAEQETGCLPTKA